MSAVDTTIAAWAPSLALCTTLRSIAFRCSWLAAEHMAEPRQTSISPSLRDPYYPRYGMCGFPCEPHLFGYWAT